MTAQPTYLNVNIGNSTFNDLTGQITFNYAEKSLTKSGAIIDKLDDYYAAVFRLVFDLEGPVFIAEMLDPASDPYSTPYSISIKSVEGASTFRGRAYLELPVDPANAKLHAGQPLDYYAAFWTYDIYIAQLNKCIQKAYANMITAGSALVAAQCPFFSSDLGIFALTCYPIDLYTYKETTVPGDRVEIYVNHAGYPLIKGWSSYPRNSFEQGHYPDINGEDYLFEILNNGFNYNPAPAAAYTGILPAVPATTSITMKQSARASLPSINSVQLISDLPSLGEYVPSISGDETKKILTDFEPDLTDIRGPTRQFYNASFGESRWIKLVGDGPLNQLTIQLVAVDWQGISRPLRLYSKTESVNLKICFAPKNMIEGYKNEDEPVLKGGAVKWW